MAVRQPASGASGRHFLRSSRLAAALVADASLRSGALVVEIGGGAGVLSHALVEAGADLIVIERDPSLAAALRARFRGAHVRVAETDARAFRWPARAFSVVANVPFVASGEILGHLLRDPRVPVQRADMIVQWEFAAKHASVWPSTMRSAYWRAWFDISITRRVARTAFSPVPSVDAAVLRFDRRAQPRVPEASHEAYRSFLSAAFGARQPLRRGLGRSLSSLQIKRLAPTLGFAPDGRPWDLDAEQWARLFAAARR